VQDRGFEASREQRAEVETVLKQVPLCESQLARASPVNAGCNLIFISSSACMYAYPYIRVHVCMHIRIYVSMYMLAACVYESTPMPLQAKLHEFLKKS
jgi:hypothetical protein